MMIIPTTIPRLLCCESLELLKITPQLLSISIRNIGSESLYFRSFLLIMMMIMTMIIMMMTMIMIINLKSIVILE